MKSDNIPSDLTVDQALQAIKKTIEPRTDRIKTDSFSTFNRIIASEILSKRDIPRFDNSAMDGYVFRKKDLDNGVRRFPVKGEIRPEDENPASLESQTCARIMTGAPVPGNDSYVVPVELVQEENNHVEVQQIPQRNPVRKQGEGYRKGETVLQKGTVIRSYEKGLIIESGNRECDVLKPVRIAIQVTGSEIDKTNDTNGPVLESLISNWPGVEITRLPVLKDQKKDVLGRIKELAEHYDLVVTTGGISAGKHDYLMQVMEDLQARIVIRKIKQKPGKPFTFTMANGTCFCHLPGNPVSAVFCAEFYTRFLLYRMLGLEFPAYTVKTNASLENHRKEKSLFVPGKLEIGSTGELTVGANSQMRSHLMQLYTGKNVYVRIDPETTYQPGEPVPVIPFSSTSLT